MQIQAKPELIKCIIKSHNHHGYSAIQWFQWLLDDCLAGFGKRLEKGWDEKILPRLRELSGLYANAVFENPFSDVLGSVYVDLASNYGRKHLGQFFSPETICTFMSACTNHDHLFENKPIVRIMEPSSGAGGMILSFMDEILRSNPDNLKKLSITGIDLDRICVKMTTLQIMANLLIHQRQLGEICIFHGNSLLPLTTIPVFYHASSPEFMQAEAELRKKEKEEKTVSTPPAEPAQIIQPKGQMSLFDLQI